MTPFVKESGVAAPLMRINIDTDAIIPSREMKWVSKKGLAGGLFAGWRYRNAETRDPDLEFVLNRSPFDTATILLAGNNFGCGSSREHAVWALKEWGFRAVIAPGFGSIFQSNCIRNGLLPVVLEENAVRCIADAMLADPNTNPVTVDLQDRTVSMAGHTWHFTIADKDRHMLINGLDAIAQTLQSEDEIAGFEAADRQRRPWIYL